MGSDGGLGLALSLYGLLDQGRFVWTSFVYIPIHIHTCIHTNLGQWCANGEVVEAWVDLA